MITMKYQSKKGCKDEIKRVVLSTGDWEDLLFHVGRWLPWNIKSYYTGYIWKDEIKRVVLSIDGREDLLFYEGRWLPWNIKVSNGAKMK